MKALADLDRWQQRHEVPAVLYSVIRKYSTDKANLLVVALGWYGFTAIYPLLLILVTIFGFIGAPSLGNSIVSTLHQFPVIGQDFKPGAGSQSLHGSVPGLVIGILGLLYGAQGVTQTAQQTMARVWNIPNVERPSFLPRLGRSLLGLAVIGISFLVSAATSGLATGSGHSWAVRIPILAGLLVVNACFYLAAFRVLTPGEVETRPLWPGAVAGGVGFTALTTVGTGLVEHQVKHMAATYGALAAVIGVVTYLLLLAKVSVYAAELNPVLERRLWPRALPTMPPTEADDQVLHDLVHEERHRADQKVGVGFGERSPDEAKADAAQADDLGPQPDLDGSSRTGQAPGRG